MIDVFGKARIQHADTGVVYEIDKDLLDFERTGSDLYDGEIMIESSAIIQHPQLGRLTWIVWEYPIRFQNDDGTNVGPHKILENFKFEFELDEDVARYDSNKHRVNYLVKWFKENYRNLDEGGLYHESKEGGYHGDIRDASDELQENFPDDDYDVIEAAVEEIEASGNTQWTPIYDDKESLIGDNLKDIEDAFNTLTDNAPEPTTDPAFAFDEGNRLHIIPPPDNQPVDSQDDLLNELRTITDDMLQSLRGANAHQELIPIIEKYKEALSGNQMSISRLYGRGVRLDKMVRAINRGIEAKELPSLPINTETYLESVREIHGAYIMSHAKGRNLVQDAADYHQPPEQPEGFKEAVEQFSNNIKNNSALFDERVREHVPNILMDIGKGEHSKRLNQIGETTLTKFVSALFKGIRKVGGKAIQWIAVHAVVKSNPGQIAITASTDFINTAWSFLINNAPSLKTITDYLSPESSWLESASNILARIMSMIIGE